MAASPFLRSKLPEFVSRGDFGFASGQQPGGGYSRVWFSEMLPPDEVTFDADVYLLTKAKAKVLKAKPEAEPPVVVAPPNGTTEIPSPPVTTGDLSHKPETGGAATAGPPKKTVRISGTIPPEVWNRLGTKLLPKLKAGSDLRIGLDFILGLDTDAAVALQLELR